MGRLTIFYNMKQLICFASTQNVGWCFERGIFGVGDFARIELNLSINSGNHYLSSLLQDVAAD